MTEPELSAEPLPTFGTTTTDVPQSEWLGAAETLQNKGFSFFDWLSAYDDTDDGLAVVLSVWNPEQRKGELLRTRVARDTGTLPTLTGLWPGANWHERETFEMFGIAFEGHPNLVSLLLPDGFEGHPLRKEFVLASRVAKAWPGAKEPGEGHGDAPARRKMQPPGVPDPDIWGPKE